MLPLATRACGHSLELVSAPGSVVCVLLCVCVCVVCVLPWEYELAVVI